jgi:HAD superfamily hydrolase (TIGR01509 family)
MIGAVVFDFDGLIVDTESPDYHSWREIFEEHGCALPRDTWGGNIGLGAADIRYLPFQQLQAQLTHPMNSDEIHARRRKRYLELIDAQPILDGVESYIADAKRLGLKVAVASSSDCAWVTGHLTRLNLIQHFEVIRCADDVENTKPHPELYLAAVAALGVSPHEAVALEDSSHGLTSAKAAGLYAVAIPNPMTHCLPLEHADLRLNSLSDMPLETLLATLEKQ